MSGSVLQTCGGAFICDCVVTDENAPFTEVLFLKKIDRIEPCEDNNGNRESSGDAAHLSESDG